jgi:hypothetical protein
VLAPQLVALFWEVLKMLGDGAQVEEVGQSGCVFRLSWLGPFLAWFFFSTMRQVASAICILHHVVLPHHGVRNQQIKKQKQKQQIQIKKI